MTKGKTAKAPGMSESEARLLAQYVSMEHNSEWHAWPAYTAAWGWIVRVTPLDHAGQSLRSIEVRSFGEWAEERARLERQLERGAQ